jgi:two-component system, OmpR family, sensor kinase
MASLRARLIAGLLALAAVGLLVLAGVTYAEQRRFLYDRVDQQARAAPFAVAVALNGGGFGSRDTDPNETPGRSVQRPPPGGPGAQPPAGTFGERRASNGITVEGEPVSAGRASRSTATTRATGSTPSTIASAASWSRPSRCARSTTRSTSCFG